MKHWMILMTAVGVLAPGLGAQQYQRRATIRGGGDRDQGKCTIEVVVDGTAEIEVRGDQGVIRNLSGQPAQWRRFECTSAMPGNAPNFRFAGVDGRGRQQLVRDPRQGGAAVVRIEDSQGGSEGYTFDLMWGGGGEPPRTSMPPVMQRPGEGRYAGRRFTTEQAVNVCQDSVRQQARMRGRRIEFRETRLDDQPGRNDWVVGMVDVMRGPNAPEDHMRFSCSVNFDTGEVRSVELSPMGGGYRQGGPDRVSANIALDTCQQAVRSRMRTDNYGRVEFQSIRIDNAPGRDDWVIGAVSGERGRGPESFNFSCSVDLRDGRVRSVDVTRR
jgi:hypothetical protein